jgi:hypothetical protein
MMMLKRLHAVAVATSLSASLAGCAVDLEPGAPPTLGEPVVEPPPPTEDPVDPLTRYTAAQAVDFLGRVVPAFAGRALSASELTLLQEQGGLGIRTVLERVVDEEGFAQAARLLIEQKLAVSGTREGIDFSLPGNLAHKIAKERLPWGQILTADTCIDENDQAISCDSGAPYTAGVLTTRGFLASRAGRFNLTRSSTLMRTFACRGYPQEDELQPRLPKELLIPMFRADSAADQTDASVGTGFGNGDSCYRCHGQFSAHAQLFVKFDEVGLYRPEATGLQDEAGELGRSFDNLFTSHMVDPAAAAIERSQFFGVEVQNVTEAAAILAESDVFFACQARNLLEYGLLLDASFSIDALLLDEIADAARAIEPEPSLNALTVATFTHPIVIESVLASLAAGGGP